MVTQETPPLTGDDTPHVEEVYFLLKGITKPSSKVAVSTLHVYQQQMRVLVALHLH